MATGPRYRVPFRRRREGKTDYRHRLRLISGRVPRLVVRRSLRNITAQLISVKPEGDVTMAQANSREIVSMGYKGSPSNTTAAYLVGMLVGKKALEAGINRAVLDIGLATASNGSRLFAALKGAVDYGLDVPHDPRIFPAIERIRGEQASREVGDIDSVIKKIGGPELPKETGKKKSGNASKKGKSAEKNASKKN